MNSAAPSRVTWGLGATAPAEFVPFLEEVIQRTGARRLCDIGGGAKPALPLGTIERLGLTYTVLDISADELAKAPDEYHKIEGDACAPGLETGERFDLAFSRMLLEHLADPATFHENVRQMLVPDGHAVHFFPTLWEPAFVANRLLPESLGERILLWLRPGRVPEGRGAKFPAYYRWCRGPTQRQLRRFVEAGYVVEEYRGFFGTESYLVRIPALQRVENHLAETMLRRPRPEVTSYAYAVLRRAGS